MTVGVGVVNKRMWPSYGATVMKLLGEAWVLT